MKSTLADIRQLFNVTSIANAVTVDNLAEGELGIFAEGSLTSTADTVAFSTLPKKFTLALRKGGKLYYSFDVIDKNSMYNQVYKAYQAEVPEIWEATLKGCGCDCMDSVLLNVHYNETGLIDQDGLSWNHRDTVYEATKQELSCLCDCEGKVVLQNHLLTQLLYKKLLANPSPYYEAEVAISVAGVDTGGTLPVSGMTKGDLYIKTGASAGLHIYDGTAWKLIGNSTGTLTDVDTFVAVNKDVNSGDVPANYSAELKLVIKGKTQNNPGYADLDVNYVVPRGVTLRPFLVINGSIAMEFTKKQSFKYEIGAGSDLRADEWANMNYYTDLNFYPQLTDGIAAKNLKYQFENGVNYNAVVFEFTTPKVERNSGEKRMFGVLIATAVANTTTATKLQSIFIPA